MPFTWTIRWYSWGRAWSWVCPLFDTSSSPVAVVVSGLISMNMLFLSNVVVVVVDPQPLDKQTDRLTDILCPKHNQCAAGRPTAEPPIKHICSAAINHNHVSRLSHGHVFLIFHSCIPSFAHSRPTATNDEDMNYINEFVTGCTATIKNVVGEI